MSIPVGQIWTTSGPATTAECTLFFGPTPQIVAVAFSPDGLLLAAGGNKEVAVWDVVTGKLARRAGIGQLAGQVQALAFVAKDQLLVGGGVPGKSGELKLIDVQTGSIVHDFGGRGEQVLCIAVSPDGKLAAVGGADSEVHVWSLADRKAVATLKDHAGWVNKLTFSKDGKLLASAGADRAVRAWKVDGWSLASTMRDSEPMLAVAFNQDGASLVAAAGGGERGLRGGRCEDQRWTRAVPAEAVMNELVMGKNNRLYAACSDRCVRIMGSYDGRAYTTFRGHSDWVYAVALHPDGKRLASASGDGTVRIWTETDGKCLAVLVHMGQDDWAAVTPAGYFDASNPALLRWRTREGQKPLDVGEKLRQPDMVKKSLSGTDVPTAGELR